MSKKTGKERIEELERRVAELEAQPRVNYLPWFGVIPPYSYKCAACGNSYVFGLVHICSWTFWSSSSDSTTYSPYAQVLSTGGQ